MTLFLHVVILVVEAGLVLEFQAFALAFSAALLQIILVLADTLLPLLTGLAFLLALTGLALLLALAFLLALAGLALLTLLLPLALLLALAGLGFPPRLIRLLLIGRPLSGGRPPPGCLVPIFIALAIPFFAWCVRHDVPPW